MKLMTVEQVRCILAEACEESGSQAAWARKYNISLPYVSDVLRGNREPGKSILKALGLGKIVRYERRQR